VYSWTFIGRSTSDFICSLSEALPALVMCISLATDFPLERKIWLFVSVAHISSPQ